MTEILLTDGIKKNIRNFVNSKKKSIGGISSEKKYLTSISKMSLKTLQLYFPNLETIYQDFLKIRETQIEPEKCWLTIETEMDQKKIADLFPGEEHFIEPFCKELLSARKAQTYYPFILQSLDEMRADKRWGWVAKAIDEDWVQYQAFYEERKSRDSLSNRERWSKRIDEKGEQAKSAQDRKAFENILQRIDEETFKLYGEWSKKIQNTNKRRTDSEKYIIPEAVGLSKNPKFYYWFRQIAFDLMEDQVAFLLYYLDLYYGYIPSMLSKDELVKMMIAEWTRVVKNTTAHVQGAYIENASVWFNLQEFWNRINRDAFANAFVGNPDFLNEQAHCISVISEDVLKDYIRSSTCDYILILTANKVEHTWCSRLMRKLLGENDKLYRCILTEGTSQNVYEYINVGKYRIFHIAPNATGSFTLSGSFQSVNDTLEIFAEKRTNIKNIFSLGIAYGLYPNRNILGDVLVSSRIYTYETYKRKNNQLKEMEKHFYQPKEEDDNRYLEIFSSSNETDQKKKDEQYHKAENKKDTLFVNSIFHAWYRSVLSGSVVLSDAYEKKRLLDVFEKRTTSKGKKENVIASIGGEMEATGIWYALWTNGNRAQNIPFHVIKAFCDWGAMKNSWALITEKSDVEKIDKLKGLGREDMNDAIKDGVQAMGVYNAFVTMAYLLKHLGSMKVYDELVEKYDPLEGLF